MAGVEEELWNIFTFYTLRGNPLDLTRLSVRKSGIHAMVTIGLRCPPLVVLLFLHVLGYTA